MKTLSRRERQIMEILYARGQATAGEVQEAMADAPSYSAIRAMLRILEDKGHVQHTNDANRYIYRPVESPERARKNALRDLVGSLFEGSVERAVAALVEPGKLKKDELDRLAALIDRARKGA